MQKIAIGVYNNNLELVGVINEEVSIQVNDNLSSASTISLTLLLTSQNIQILQQENLLILNNNSKLNAQVFIIEYIQKVLNTDGSTSLTVQGSSLLSILNRRVLTKLYNFQNTDVGTILQDILNTECINPTDVNRQFPNLIIGDLNLNATVSQLNPLTDFSNPELGTSVGSAIENILESVGAGIEIVANLNTGNFIINFIEGTDRTLEQSSVNPVVLANELNNIMSQKFTTNIKNYTNICYVSGTINNSTEQIMCCNSSMIPTGYARWESSQECEIEGLNATTYVNEYQAIGSTYIKTQDIYKNSSVQFNISNTTYAIKRDFNLGDTISFISKDWNIKESLQITQITETWANGGYSITMQLGKQEPTLAKILKIKK